MCHFITLVLPDAGALERCRKLPSPFGLGLARIENPWVQQALPAGAVQARASDRSCDCGTALGRLRESPGRRVERTDLDRLRARGWSERKVARWLEERERVAAREARVGAGRVTETEQGWPDPDGWVARLAALLGPGVSPSVGILLHWYRGRLDTERITLVGREAWRLDADLGAALYRLPEDTLVTVVRTSP